MEKLDLELQNTSGFTLIEALVTLVVVVILALITIPSIRSILTDSRIKSAADTFVQQIQTARSEAAQRQQDVYLSFQSGSSWCYGSNAGSSCSCSPSNNCGLSSISSSSYPSVTSTITSGFTSSNSIYFDGVRGLPNQSAQLSFQIDSKTITITINALGGISVCSTNVLGYPTC